MFLAADEPALVLQGPKPPLPPGFWENQAGNVAVAGICLLVIFFAARQLFRRPPTTVRAHLAFEEALRTAEQQGALTAGAITSALRTYLAAVDPAAAASLSTEELERHLQGCPIFLPARQPLLAALRAADAAKFATGTVEAALLLAGVREAVRRIEDARQTFQQA